MRLTQYISESINDKSILKAVFFVGYPGAGKTTIINKIKDASMPVVSISTDIWTEFYGKSDKHYGTTDWSVVGSSAKKLTVADLSNKINGLFPIYIDTTGADVGRFQKRVQFLRDVGYDVSLVVVSVALDTSVQRVSIRNQSIKRQVSHSFVRDAYDSISKSIPVFKAIIPDNITVVNDGLTDKDTIKVYNTIMKKLREPIYGGKGKKLVDFMRDNKYKYYSDVPEEWRSANGYPSIDKSVIEWFNRN